MSEWETPTTDAELSKLLFEAREQVSMLADIVESQTGGVAAHTRGVLDRLDNYRRERGWSPHGFGGESDSRDTGEKPDA